MLWEVAEDSQAQSSVLQFAYAVLTNTMMQLNISTRPTRKERKNSTVAIEY